jgi:uncharacterized protein
MARRHAEPTPDGHYVVIDGRKWRATNPNLPEDERKKLVSELMSARRAVAAALKSQDKEAEAAARDRVQAAKEGLGERGPKWWEEDKTEQKADKKANKNEKD